MSRFFKRAIDAYRILTGRDDAVQKGIMQLQKEIVEVSCAFSYQFF
jgi:hypothetical protein